ncbi:mycofactocin system FadH/OYE family oxidoreductase 1 [Marinitenerispora sediminis]|uniref:Mycofactocin system FadH/OYE family oxidoreductase 1 n=1 Tax=Marinitenerispora sediminis TaxID=1931232 RepID=A0A368TA83_9ACTN|nr:mycofactocin system FadH/OYE family oxidoreductase 1 [Marinitenerispora sediminis]RCV57940.1 mycofactocin system FadH/OYE family oxidoreductase 1 [Marinitenerispora sediminis]RCV59690.1 mycofactocin system FadH/OYE family oxidoreductase 1 [Marinitenerispora sediminis]RCV62327.1 mycofactocin system FadH/OYE family oxidoreductase 1 [Marinitenerispora sediminis]
MQLLSPLRFACGTTARNRLVFGPHATNLGRGRALSERHVAYYRRRAAGGAGIVVTETASVLPNDRPYERAPLAAECGAGWSAIADACHGSGTLVLGALGHSGQQGVSGDGPALWAPSRVSGPVGGEVPVEMDAEDIAATVAAFAAAARLAVRSGLDGVEVDAGPRALVRQFLSGLTNLRDDGYGGRHRARFAHEILGAVRSEVGRHAVVGLRLSCDELAPGGLVPEAAARLAAELAARSGLDYVTVVRGSTFAPDADRPDGHTAPGFASTPARRMRSWLPREVAVCAQGSIVDPETAEGLVTEGTAQLVEMTRAQIADAELGGKLAAGTPERVRPCVLCNAACQVRRPGSPVVSCLADPRSGYETEDPPETAPAARPRDVLVIGGGPAGLEAARVAAAAGHRVRVVEAAQRTGGMLRVAAAGAGRERLALLADWFAAECVRLGVRIDTGHRAGPSDIDARLATGGAVVLCTGGLPGRIDFPVRSGVVVLDAAEALRRGVPAGPVAVHDPVGGPVAVSVAEALAAAGREVTLITPDHQAGARLAHTGDQAAASARLARAGVTVVRRSRPHAAGDGVVAVTHVYAGGTSEVRADVLVDCGFRLPADELWRGPRLGFTRAGDAVAPRGVYEAVLDGRRAALDLDDAEVAG